MNNVLLSIIVPTYNEAQNIPLLVYELDRALNGKYSYEIIIVDDDSPDGTADVARKLSSRYPVRVVVRRGVRGLGTAVVEGFRHAKGRIILVMDADLQHPPELVPKLVNAVLDGADIAIASRYVEGGRIDGWGLIRKIISKGAIFLIHVLLPETRNIKDPVSGFFALKREIIENVELQPRGFKILLEILARCRSKYKRIIEVPFTFKPRLKGKSKLRVKTIIDFLLHLLELSEYRILKFMLVGASGILVNLGVFYLLTYLAKLPIPISGIAALEASIINNFILNDIWTFRSRRSGSILRRLGKFHISRLAGLAVNYIVLIVLSFIGINPLIADLAGIVLGYVVNYILSEVYVWRHESRGT